MKLFHGGCFCRRTEPLHETYDRVDSPSGFTDIVGYQKWTQAIVSIWHVKADQPSIGICRPSVPSELDSLRHWINPFFDNVRVSISWCEE
jgi:hypothetical protein